MSPQLLLHVSLPHNYWFYCHRIKGKRQDSFLGGSQSQTLHIWQSTANKNLIPSPPLWNQKVFFPNLLFVVCSSLKGKPGKCTFCRTKKKKKKIKLYLIGIEPGEGRSKMQGNNRKYSCFWSDPHTSSLSYNAQMSWKLSATPSGIPHFSWTFII